MRAFSWSPLSINVIRTHVIQAKVRRISCKRAESLILSVFSKRKWTAIICVRTCVTVNKHLCFYNKRQRFNIKRTYCKLFDALFCLLDSSQLLLFIPIHTCIIGTNLSGLLKNVIREFNRFIYLANKLLTVYFIK